MNKVDLCTLLKKTVCRVLIQHEGKTGGGSGVLVSATGAVLTAQHVVASAGKIRVGTLTVHIPNRGPVDYKIASPVGLAIDIGEPMFIRPLPIDLAVLKPQQQLAGLDYLRLRDDIPPEGTEVMMAGFPDDILLPFMFDEAFEVMNPDMTTIRKEIERSYKQVIRPMLCVDTMLGSVVPMPMDINGKKFTAATYTTPIGFTHGGSGGAIVDANGLLVAIAIRKGITDATMWSIATGGGTLSRLPTNTGYALSHRLITEMPGTGGI